MHNDRFSNRGYPLNDVGNRRAVPPVFSVPQDDGFNSGFTVDRMVASPASATDRSRSTRKVRAVGRSPVQEFDARAGRVREIPQALKIVLSGGRSKVTISRNGISFRPKPLNAEAPVKSLTWWDADSALCQPCNFGREVIVAYNRSDFSMIHVLDEKGQYLDTLPLKDKVKWFDREATEKGISDTRRIASRVNAQLQTLHVEDSEAAEQRAAVNRHRLETIVQTFPMRGEKAPARSSESAAAVGMAQALMKRQRDEYEAQEAEVQQRVQAEGADAANLLLDDSDNTNFDATEHDMSGGDVMDFILSRKVYHDRKGKKRNDAQRRTNQQGAGS